MRGGGIRANEAHGPPSFLPSPRRQYVVFYAGCAPTHTAPGGVLCMSADDSSKPILWFHGPHKNGVVGGNAWMQESSACAFPTRGAGLACNARMLENVVQTGYKSTWGYAKLLPLVFVE